MIHSKSCYKYELAEYYGIHLNTLMRWVNENDELKNELYKIGYKDNSKKFTPAQVRVVSGVLE